MKNNNWKQSKIIGGFKGSFRMNPSYGIGSFLVANLTIKHLWNFIRKDISPRNVLDVGCGYAPHYIFFYPKLSLVNYVGVDWEKSPHYNGSIDYYTNLNEPMIIDGKFDLILLMDVIEHLEDVSILLDSLKNNLNADGTMYITVPFFYWIHEAPHDYNRYTIYQLKRLLNNSGFSIEDYRIVGGGGTALLDLISKNFLRPLKLNSMLTRMFLDKFNSLFELIGLNRNVESYPIEYIIKVRHL